MCPEISKEFKRLHKKTSWKTSSQLINKHTQNPSKVSPLYSTQTSECLRALPGSVLFLIWGHEGLFAGKLWQSTWPHKDRQHWLSCVNTCWRKAPLALHGVPPPPPHPDSPNVSTWITVCSVPSDMNCALKGRRHLLVVSNTSDHRAHGTFIAERFPNRGV